MTGSGGHDGAPPLEVAIIGAGISGLCLAMRLKTAGIDSFAVFEKASGLGGTWRDNTYPGANCDVPSLFYSFSFAFKRDWTRVFAGQAEILEYLEQCADRYALRPHLRFETPVAEARWDGAAGLWRLRTGDGAEHAARVLVSGVGQLNRPAYPDIPGLDGFRGTTFHSARWNHAHDLAGERVAVIGNAASAIQFIPRIAPAAARLHVFQRSANWMIPRLDRPYTERERWVFTHVPFVARLQRWLVWARLEARWPAFSKGSRVARRLERQALEDMRRHVSDPGLQAVLTPDYPVGCKRILISDDYYPALARPNVEVVTSPIERATPEGLVTADGRTRSVDTIIFATGFRTTEFLAPMHVVGRDGRTLEDVWRDGAEAYLGIALPGFPNFFMLYGPNTNLGHNSIIFMIERQVRLVMECIERTRRGDLRALEVRGEAMRRYNDEVQRSLKKTVWDAGCHSWYKTASGRITNNWPHGTVSYWWRTRRVRWPDFELRPVPA